MAIRTASSVQNLLGALKTSRGRHLLVFIEREREREHDAQLPRVADLPRLGVMKIFVLR